MTTYPQAQEERSNYDTEEPIIIVGGRPAGASLAAYLGKAKVPVLLLERATFPSYPAVSSPFLLPHAMELLDAIGVDECNYARGSPKISTATLEFRDIFKADIPLGERGGRDYCYAVDRSDFDSELWNNLKKFPSVKTMEGVVVTGLWRQDDNDGNINQHNNNRNSNVQGAIIGVKAKSTTSGEVIMIRGRCVVGADGRASTVARLFQSPVTHERKDCETAVWYAFWEGVAEYSCKEKIAKSEGKDCTSNNTDEKRRAVAQIHSSVDGWSIVVQPLSRNRHSVFVQCPAPLFQSSVRGTSPKETYLRVLQECHAVWRRFGNAKMVSNLRGLTRVHNLFRQPAGGSEHTNNNINTGRWALVGDAYHQKDSIDAQGMYDALWNAKILSEHLISWYYQQNVSWETAMSEYATRITAETRPMFDATMGRVQREIYGTPPTFIIQSVLRWLLTDDVYRDSFSKVLVRRLDPTGFPKPGLMLGALWRGMSKDLAHVWKNHSFSFATMFGFVGAALVYLLRQETIQK